MHLIFRAKDNNPEELLKSFKTFTSKALQAEIENNIQESRKEWMLWLMERAGLKNSNVKKRQFWQQQNHPIELWSTEVIDQMVDYIHQNPVVCGFVTDAHHWKYSLRLIIVEGKEF